MGARSVGASLLANPCKCQFGIFGAIVREQARSYGCARSCSAEGLDANKN